MKNRKRLKTEFSIFSVLFKNYSESINGKINQFRRCDIFWGIKDKIVKKFEDIRILKGRI